MDFKEFENLLGQNISIASKVLDVKFENNVFGKNFYTIPEGTDNDFYGMNYYNITILTDEKDIIQSITIHFCGVINRNFYNLFIQNYGEPNNILIIKNEQIIEEGTLESSNFIQNLTQKSFELREGNFDEDPLYIIWNKQYYQIKAFLRHRQSISEITFSIEED